MYVYYIYIYIHIYISILDIHTYPLNSLNIQPILPYVPFPNFPPLSPARPLARRWPGIEVRFPGRRLHPPGGLPDPSLLTWEEFSDLKTSSYVLMMFLLRKKHPETLSEICSSVFFGDRQKNIKKIEGKSIETKRQTADGCEFC